LNVNSIPCAIRDSINTKTNTDGEESQENGDYPVDSEQRYKNYGRAGGRNTHKAQGLIPSTVKNKQKQNKSLWSSVPCVYFCCSVMGPVNLHGEMIFQLSPNRYMEFSQVDKEEKNFKGGLTVLALPQVNQSFYSHKSLCHL
jgi:hypothetical protein